MARVIPRNLTWSEVSKAIQEEEYDLFGRLSDGADFYDASSAALKREWETVADFILNREFQFDCQTHAETGKKYVCKDNLNLGRPYQCKERYGEWVDLLHCDRHKGILMRSKADHFTAPQACSSFPSLRDTSFVPESIALGSQSGAGSSSSEKSHGQIHNNFSTHCSACTPRISADSCVTQKEEMGNKYGSDCVDAACRGERIDSVCTSLHRNDYPYALEGETCHYLLWSLPRALSSEEVVYYAQFRLGLNPKDYLYFENPPALRSIPQIFHYHIFTRHPIVIESLPHSHDGN
tara:strand:- start:1068 stop:1946 length:879 start_codon:yes stop_codon:yes gene_type:complete